MQSVIPNNPKWETAFVFINSKMDKGTNKLFTQWNAILHSNGNQPMMLLTQQGEPHTRKAEQKEGRHSGVSAM